MPLLPNETANIDFLALLSAQSSAAATAAAAKSKKAAAEMNDLPPSYEDFLVNQEKFPVNNGEQIYKLPSYSEAVLTSFFARTRQ